MDCTWDDPISRTPILRHDFCLIGPETLALTHYWEGEDCPIPAEYDPAWEQLDTNNITSADMFRKCLAAQVVQKKTTIVLRVTSPEAYGGTGCVENFVYPEAIYWYLRGGYDASMGAYVYYVQY